MNNISRRIFCAAAAAVVSATGFAGPFTAGNLVVVRVGDGVNPVASVASQIFLEEFTLGGAPVQTINGPVTTVGANRQITMTGNSTSEGALFRSTDKHFLTFVGYDAAVGTATPGTTSAATINRVVAVANNAGVINTTTALSNANNNNQIRSAISTNGTDIWIGGNGTSTTGGALYTTIGSSTAVQLASTPTNGRVIGIFNGQLYLSTQSGAFKGVNSVGTGLPTTSGQSTTNLPGFSSITVPVLDNYGYYFADANTLYVAQNGTVASGAGILKLTFDGSTWSIAYTLNVGLTTGIRHLIGKTVAGNTVLYATTGPTVVTASNQIVTVTDTGVGSEFFPVATAPTNEIYRGIAFAPEASGTIVNANSIVVTSGDQFSGNLGSLANSDNDRYCLFDDTDTLIGQVVITGTSPSLTPSEVHFTAETSAARSGLAVAIDLFDYNASDWANFVGQEETTADSIKEAVAGAAVVSSPTGAMQARITWSPVNDEDPSQDGWLQCVDQAQWRVVL